MLPSRVPCVCRAAPAGGRAARRLTLAMTLLLFSGAFGCAVPQPRGQGRLEHRVEPTTQRGYWLYLPRAYVQSDSTALRARRWPLVVTFHGMKPFDNARPQALEWQQEADRFGFVVLAPELRTPDVFNEFPLRTISPTLKSDENATLAIMDQVFANTQADPTNVLATSWSSGGYLAHYMMNRHPNRFTCLGVRQSNFSSAILDGEIARQSAYNPVLILNTQNDFAICKRESREAVAWYESQGVKNVFWIAIKDKGHERTPDLAADFFGRVAGIKPSGSEAVVMHRQAIDGNQAGLAFLSGDLSGIQRSPDANRLASSRVTRANPARATRDDASTRRPAPGRTAPTRRETSPPTLASAGAGPGGDRAPAVVSRGPRMTPVTIYVSSAVGVQPLQLDFSADCPASWRNTANFLWTLNGVPIASGLNGQKTIASAGEHTLSVLVVTADGQQHRASKSIRVIPRTRD